MSFRLKPLSYERDGPVCTRSTSSFCRNCNSPEIHPNLNFRLLRCCDNCLTCLRCLLRRNNNRRIFPPHILVSDGDRPLTNTAHDLCDTGFHPSTVATGTGPTIATGTQN